MYQGKKILAVIPIRGNSKSIKDLNIYPIYKIPLFLLSAEEAKKSKYIDTICISTDSMKYALIAEQNGFIIPFIRPSFLSTDDAKIIDVIVDARDYYRRKNKEYDCIITLLATAPLKTVDDIDNAIEMYFKNAEKSLVSITDCFEVPQLIRTIEDNKLKAIVNMSSTYNKNYLPKYYKVNEAIYINAFSEINSKVSLNDNEIGFYMPLDRSVSIKSQKDIKTVRTVIKGQKVREYLQERKK